MQIRRENAGALVGGSILIGLGVLFLLAQFVGAGAWHFLWPFIVIGVGAMFFVAMFAGGRSTVGLAIPGSILSVIGLMLLLQNLTAYWTSWSYGWTVILMAVGLGIWIMGWRTGDAHQRESGLKVLRVGLVLFILFGAFFELALFGAGGPTLRRVVFPVLLILLGLYLIARRTGLWPWPAAAPAVPSDSNTPPTPSA